MAYVSAQDATTIRRLRQGIGLVGLALPFAIGFGSAWQTGEWDVLNSISASYYTGMRDVFVGSLCAIGVFLIFYRLSRWDDILGTVAGVAAILVALFPASPGAHELVNASVDGFSGIMHGIAATVLFLSLAAFCFFLFPRSIQPYAMTRRKKVRNVVYLLCGVAILAGLGLAVLGATVMPQHVEDRWHPMWWGETVAIVAFGVAWTAKSNTLLPDVET